MIAACLSHLISPFSISRPETIFHVPARPTTTGIHPGCLNVVVVVAVAVMVVFLWVLPCVQNPDWKLFLFITFMFFCRNIPAWTIEWDMSLTFAASWQISMQGRNRLSLRQNSTRMQHSCGSNVYCTQQTFVKYLLYKRAVSRWDRSIEFLRFRKMPSRFNWPDWRWVIVKMSTSWNVEMSKGCIKRRTTRNIINAAGRLGADPATASLYPAVGQADVAQVGTPQGLQQPAFGFGKCMEMWFRPSTTNHPCATKNVDLNFELHYFGNFWRLKHSATCQTLHANLPRSMLAGFDALLVERLTKEAWVSAALTAFLPHGLERCRQAWYVEARSFAHNVAKPEATNSWSVERWWTNRIYIVSIDI